MPPLTEDERTQLLRVARESIEEVLAGRSKVAIPEAGDALNRPAGAFVTLRSREGELRGCIGSIHPVAPLIVTVSNNAINAAFRDPRFPPLSNEELAEIDIEISVMSPLSRVTDVEEIQVGRDGLIITRGHRAGLLLPQVATEQGWGREEFLRRTCMKAGLPPDAWHSPECSIERFSAEVFAEPSR